MWYISCAVGALKSSFESYHHVTLLFIYNITYYRPVSTTDQVYAVIRSLLSTSASQQTLKTIKMSDIEELAASKVYIVITSLIISL